MHQAEEVVRLVEDHVAAEVADWVAISMQPELVDATMESVEEPETTTLVGKL